MSVIGERRPINIRLSVALKETRLDAARTIEQMAVLASLILSRRALRLQWVDKDEISLFRGDHHIFPIDQKYPASAITHQITRVQICVTDDLRKCSPPQLACKSFQGS